MYYLLKDRMIVDTKKLNQIDYTYNVDSREFKFNNITIVKQSEEVFELIEEGDLVAFNYNKDSIDVVSVRSVDKDPDDGSIQILSRGYAHDLDAIIAIYKLDSKGNYMKVWQKD